MASTGPAVYQVFKELILHPRRNDSHGNLYYKPGEKWTRPGWVDFEKDVSKDHGRLSAFNNEQEKYIDQCRIFLRDSITDSETSLAKRFAKKWEASNKTKAEFEDLLCDSFLDCFNEAVDKEPHLLPAFYGFLVSSFNGVEGLELALTMSIYSDSIANTRLNENMNKFVDMHEDKNELGAPKTYEVQCAAPLLAMKIIDQGRECLKNAGLTQGDKSIKNSKSKLAGLATDLRTDLMVRMIKAGFQI